MLTVNTTRPAGPAGRITRVETLMLGTAWRDFAYVRLHTDEGLTGVGEITHPYRPRETCALTEAMGHRHLIGADPFDTEEIWLRMYQGDFLRGGDVGGIVVSGVDQALHDLMGKALGVPVYRLTGGATRDRVRVYANGWYTGEREPEIFAAKAKETVARGYTALKFDPFGAGLHHLEKAELRRSVDLVAAVREAVGPDVDLFVEGHARFGTGTARQLVDALAPYEPGWFEEPLPWTLIERYAELRARAPFPISGGEHFHNRHEYKQLFATRAVDIVQPDLSMAGGFTELRKIAAEADTHGMTVAPHNSNSPLCTTASVHAVLGITNFQILETFDGLLEPYVFDAVKGALPVVDGHIELPTAPGLGIELVDEVFEEHPPSHRFWNMFAEGWEKRNRT
ncbi:MULTISPECIES: mandelate racemase/muconate lactonizing enzyme family protein [unclassified Streptomyces]|uniref:mandelate racemase/muconate lactonizing enzyme family protein n=1 Tax=unclassified Streptomyces TaxID=2593676 RepID=UPI000BACA0C6|nr:MULTISPECIES: mandelate racemase/muconate lactonizing enzyme family protein [unclassified Streptomyces]ASY36233.1 galactonate dehydratase [Streptomyces sp. CLI2509]MYX22889.1 mandelate racemase/muconate lactonizing enzyme family protein [Streptomyces sp. SID8380]